eukprot:2685614-Amphidinium_carterae.1
MGIPLIAGVQCPMDSVAELSGNALAVVRGQEVSESEENPLPKQKNWRTWQWTFPEECVRHYATNLNLVADHAILNVGDVSMQRGLRKARKRNTSKEMSSDEPEKTSLETVLVKVLANIKHLMWTRILKRRRMSLELGSIQDENYVHHYMALAVAERRVYVIRQF